jgi:polyribonucleotide nucleotidyltransferase
VGQTYSGRVVNITKFGAFVNILPGRDGLLHISKIGGGKRINRVEDVLDLGDELEVTVDDVDPNGKVSLSLAKAIDIPEGNGSAGGGGGSAPPVPADSDAVSFEDEFDAELAGQLGDLGPATANAGAGAAGGGRSSASDDERRRSRRRRR